jgi:hypothetical protein
MVRRVILALALALAATGCGPRACELFVGVFELNYCIEDVVTPWDQPDLWGFTCHDWETCQSLGYTVPCTAIDGSTYWKHTGAHCL